MRIALPALLAISLAAPIWAQTAEAPAPGTPTATVLPATVLPAITVSTVATRLMQDHVLASGMIGPVEQVYVPPLIEGQPIETLLADVGDTVEAGQVLATLSTATLTLQQSQMLANAAAVKATIAQAEAQLADAAQSAAEAAKTATRSAALLKQGTVTTAANDQTQTAATSATARVTVAEAVLKSALAQQDLTAAQMANVDLQLARTKIVAPVSGIISARNAQLGAIASAAGQPLFVIIRNGALELKADVAEADLVKLVTGQPAILTLAATPDKIAGAIRLVEPTINTTSRLGAARIAVTDASLVRAGMFAEADIMVTSRDGLAVPVTAVSAAATGETTVMLVADGMAKRQIIQTGIRDGGWIEVLSGLTAGQTVVTKAGSFVRDGERINPIAEASTN